MNKLRALLLALLALPFTAQAATVTFRNALADTGATPNTGTSFTPAVDDLVVVAALCPGTLLTSAQLTTTGGGGLTYTQVAQGQKSTSDFVYWFIADSLAPSATSQSVDFAVSGDECTGSIITVYTVAGMAKTGATALRQTAKVEDQAGGGTPAPAFASAALTGNPTLGSAHKTSITGGFTEPSGWTEGSDTALDDTADNTMETVYRDSGFTGTTITWGASVGQTHAAIILELDASSNAPSFSAGPTVTAATDGYTIGGTITGSGTLTVEAVGCAPGDAAPSNAELEAGQCGGGNAALLNASEVWTTGVANDFLLAASNKPPRMDVYVAGTDGTTDTSVSSFADQNRSARSGFALVTMASVSATGVCDLDSYFTPDCAIGDVFEYEDDTNESADCNVAFDTAGDFTLTPVAPGDCDGKQTFEISYEDETSATTGLFSAPASVGIFSADDTICVNNTAPEEDTALEPFAVVVDDPIETVDFRTIITDPDTDTLSYAVTSGTLPTGLTLNSVGTLDGTPTVESEAGVAITVTGTDGCGDFATTSFTIYPVDTWTVPNLEDLNSAESAAAIVAAAPWRADLVGLTIAGETCDTEHTAGDVVSQDPAAAAEAGAYDNIDVTLALSCSSYDGVRKVVYELSDVTGLTVWSDYIPVIPQPGCVPGTYDNDGCWAVTVISSTTGLTAWADYIPVYEVPETVNKWRYENNGWIPVNTLTP